MEYKKVIVDPFGDEMETELNGWSKKGWSLHTTINQGDKVILVLTKPNNEDKELLKS